MIPSIQSIVEMLIAHECTAQQALAWIAEYMENDELRDQFAGQAMQAMIPEDRDWSVTAERAYQMADDMLKVRCVK